MRFGADLMAHDVFSVFLCALSLAHECQDEASAVWQLQLQSALSENSEPPEPGICASPAPEDYDKPISAVLEEFPGHDGWCIFGGAADWCSTCAIGRKQKDMRPYAEGQIKTIETTEYKYLQTGKEPKKVLLPEGTLYESLTNVRDYHDLFCALNGLFNVSRSAALNDFDYLVQVSEHSCLALQSKVWNYFGLFINNLLLDPYPLGDALIEILTSDKPVVHLNQSFVDMFHYEAAVQCRLGNDKGALCVISYCALRGCMAPDGVVGQTKHGECPPV